MSKYLEKSQLPHFWQKIKDYVADYSNGGIEYPSFRYSNDEQWTGEYWSDGRKIYVKTIYSVSGGTEINLNHGVEDIGNYKVIDLTNSFWYSDFNQLYQFGNYISNVAYASVFSVTNTQIQIRFGNTWNSNWKFYITFRYTKSTDTPVPSTVNPTIDLLFPIGSQIYNAKKDFDPNVIYAGTTWKRIKGYVLAGINESNSDSNIKTSFNQASGKTIGSKWLQQHRHPWDGVNDGASSSSAPGNYPFRIFQDRNVNWNGSAGSMHYTGDGDAQNIQPTQLTYIWERTA